MNWTPPKSLTCNDIPAARSHMDDLAAALADAGFSQTLDLINSQPGFHALLLAVISQSTYLRDLLIKNPEILSDVLSLGFEKTCENTLETTTSVACTEINQQQIMQVLRKMKSRIALTCALADLGGWWRGEQVTRTLARFADASLNAAFDFILLQAHAKAQFKVADEKNPQQDSGLIALAMGKHGAFELNYSSDIDLILFYNEQAAMRVLQTDPTTFFSRVAKQLVSLLQERTSDGYVFRVDLRLRPDPSSTPPIMPLEAGLIYYESYGQNWERAALIKARPAAGDIAAGNSLLTELRPFIWRKYLDYAAIQDVHSIKRQIHAHKGHATIATRGHNIKLGRGGIREIEFFAQTQQLIAGGRIPQLRTLRTIETLQALCEHKWIDKKAVEELINAYWYLRNVEHRLQMVRDEQTHTLPANEVEFHNIALMMGYKNTEEFTSDLTTILQTVEKHYSSLFEAAHELSTNAGNLVFTGDIDDPDTLTTLNEMGYQRPSDIMRTIKGWHFGRYPALRTAQARELLTELTPQLLQEFANTGKADDTLIAMDRFIAGLPAGIQLFALLNSNPALQHLLTLLLSAAPRLAEIITRKPHVFDGLLDPSFNAVLPDGQFLEERLNQYLSKASDYESILNRARIFAAEQKFLIGVRLLNGTINAVQAGYAFSALARVMINAMLSIVTLEFEKKHGTIKGGTICVLAMGRLGSSELTAGSDLDLIFLYDHATEAEMSSGEKPLHVSQYFTRMTQRLTAAMCAPTAEGVIYELDFRLRPSGNAGPLATHVGSFFKYQREKAWTWEHQALTRARPVAGSPEFCHRVDAGIGELIAGIQNNPDLQTDIAQMRARIDREKGSDNPWNIKAVKGGLIDIEFIAQYLALKTAVFPVPDNRNTRSVIQNAPEKLLLPEAREQLLSALDHYTNVLQLLRACIDGEYLPDKSPQGLNDMVVRALGATDLAAATALLVDCEQNTARIFTVLFGKKNPRN